MAKRCQNDHAACEPTSKSAPVMALVSSASVRHRDCREVRVVRWRSPRDVTLLTWLRCNAVRLRGRAARCASVMQRDASRAEDGGVWCCEIGSPLLAAACRKEPMDECDMAFHCRHTTPQAGTCNKTLLIRGVLRCCMSGVRSCSPLAGLCWQCAELMMITICLAPLPLHPSRMWGPNGTNIQTPHGSYMLIIQKVLKVCLTRSAGAMFSRMSSTRSDVRWLSGASIAGTSSCVLPSTLSDFKLRSGASS
jgi:hypothetical protein